MVKKTGVGMIISILSYTLIQGMFAYLLNNLRNKLTTLAHTLEITNVRSKNYFWIVITFIKNVEKINIGLTSCCFDNEKKERKVFRF
jgi:hypothetical protein